MIDDKNVLAVVTARGGSKGLPGKNKKLLLGKPLVCYPLSIAQNSKYVDKIFLTTDDKEIQEIGKNMGVYCPELRPKHLSNDKATSFSVLEYVINSEKKLGNSYEYLILLEPTSPLTQASDIDLAIESLNEQKSTADSIVGISLNESSHPNFVVKLDEDNFIQTFNTQYTVQRRQDLEPAYFFDGSLYISKVDSLLKTKSFYHTKTLGYKTKKWQSFEIDDIVDFICVEAIMKNLEKIRE